MADREVNILLNVKPKGAAGIAASLGPAVLASKKAETGMQKVAKAVDVSIKKVQELGNVATLAFASGSAAIGGAVAAASPETWATLTGSFKLLAAEIGKDFIPVVVRIAAAVQSAWRAWKNLSDETRKSIVYWSTWGVTVAGVVAVLPRIITIAQAVGVAFGGLKGAIYSLGPALTWLAAHPAILALAAAAGAIALINREAKKTADYGKSAMDLAARRRPLTAEESDSDEAVKRFRANPKLSKEEKTKIADENAAKTAKSANDELRNYNIFNKLVKAATTSFLVPDELRNRIAGTVTTASNAVGVGPGTNLKSKQMSALAAQEVAKSVREGRNPDTGGKTGVGLLLAQQGHSERSGIFERYQKVMQSALNAGGNTIEGQMLQIQQESLALLQNAAKDSTTQDVVKAVKEIPPTVKR